MDCVGSIPTNSLVTLVHLQELWKVHSQAIRCIINGNRQPSHPSLCVIIIHHHVRQVQFKLVVADIGFLEELLGEKRVSE